MWRGRTSRKAAGFTLIELLVVFSLLAMLLTIAVPRYLSSIDRAKEKARDQNMSTVRDAIDKFKADQGKYPGSLQDLVTKQYLRQIPVDPVSGSTAWVVVPPASGTDGGVFDIKQPDVTSAEATTPNADLGLAPSLPPLPGDSIKGVK